jgi:hypothetical protein
MDSINDSETFLTFLGESKERLFSNDSKKSMWLCFSLGSFGRFDFLDLDQAVMHKKPSEMRFRKPFGRFGRVVTWA